MKFESSTDRRHAQYYTNPYLYTLAPSIAVCNVINASVGLGLATHVDSIRTAVALGEQRASELSASTLPK
jgi:hypothetical protein